MSLEVYYHLYQTGFRVTVLEDMRGVAEYLGGNHLADPSLSVPAQSAYALSPDALREQAVRIAEDYAEAFGTDEIEED